MFSDKNENQKYFLTDLFPYDFNEKTKAKLKGALQEYQMLLIASLEAINALDICDLHKFDPLVGENACQVRAVWIAIIASKKLINIRDLTHQIIHIKDKICALLEEKTIAKLMLKQISLGELFISEKLFIPLSTEEIFLIRCFLLAETKITPLGEKSIDCIYSKEKCDPKKLKRFGDISFSFADNLVSKLRRAIAIHSVQFVRERASASQDPHLMKMLSDEYTINHNNYLLCTPMFWTYKSVLAIAKNGNIPLMIHTQFLNQEEKHDYFFYEGIQKELSEIDHDKIAWIVQGLVQLNFPSKSCWKDKFLKFPIEKVILAGAADHRQYPCQERDASIHLLQDREFESYRSFAKTEGFCADNPTTFLIQHVYPSKIKNFLQRYFMELPRGAPCTSKTSKESPSPADKIIP